ncbi:MAG: hypothetical protein ACTSQ0_03000 [Candidatus Heimdallarchaeota archaeon]
MARIKTYTQQEGLTAAGRDVPSIAGERSRDWIVPDNSGKVWEAVQQVADGATDIGQKLHDAEQIDLLIKSKNDFSIAANEIDIDLLSPKNEHLNAEERMKIRDESYEKITNLQTDKFKDARFLNSMQDYTNRKNISSKHNVNTHSINVQTKKSIKTLDETLKLKIDESRLGIGNPIGEGVQAITDTFIAIYGDNENTEKMIKFAVDEFTNKATYGSYEHQIINNPLDAEKRINQNQKDKKSNWYNMNVEDQDDLIIKSRTAANKERNRIKTKRLAGSNLLIRQNKEMNSYAKIGKLAFTDMKNIQRKNIYTFGPEKAKMINQELEENYNAGLNGKSIWMLTNAESVNETIKLEKIISDAPTDFSEQAMSKRNLARKTKQAIIYWQQQFEKDPIKIMDEELQFTTVEERNVFQRQHGIQEHQVRIKNNRDLDAIASAFKTAKSGELKLVNDELIKQEGVKNTHQIFSNMIRLKKLSENVRFTIALMNNGLENPEVNRLLDITKDTSINDIQNKITKDGGNTKAKEDFYQMASEKLVKFKNSLLITDPLGFEYNGIIDGLVKAALESERQNPGTGEDILNKAINNFDSKSFYLKNNPTTRVKKDLVKPDFNEGNFDGYLTYLSSTIDLKELNFGYATLRREGETSQDFEARKQIFYNNLNRDDFAWINGRVQNTQELTYKGSIVVNNNGRLISVSNDDDASSYKSRRRKLELEKQLELESPFINVEEKIQSKTEKPIERIEEDLELDYSFYEIDKEEQLKQRELKRQIEIGKKKNVEKQRQEKAK